MRTIKLLKQTLTLVFILNVTSVFAGSWTFINSGTDAKLEAVFFINPKVGFVAGSDSSGTSSGNFLRTIDGGITWVKVDASEYWFSALSFTSTTIGYALAGGSILKTTNGGDNWTPTSYEGKWLNSLTFSSVNIGYACGLDGTIVKTINGGDTWNIQTSNTTKNLADICFISANTGFVVGQDGTVLKTIDGGETWESRSFGISNHNSISFPDWDAGYILSGSKLEKSISGGDFWDTRTLFNGISLNEVYFTDSKTGYLIGSGGVIIKTSNGSNTWVLDTSNTKNTLNNIFFVENTGFIVGDHGTILKNNGSSVPNKTTVISSNNEIKILPNPTTGHFEILINEPLESDYKIEIFNNLGSIINAKVNQSRQSAQIDLTGYPTGVYLIRLKSNHLSFKSKIIKQ